MKSLEVTTAIDRLLSRSFHHRLYSSGAASTLGGMLNPSASVTKLRTNARYSRRTGSHLATFSVSRGPPEITGSSRSLFHWRPSGETIAASGPPKARAFLHSAL